MKVWELKQLLERFDENKPVGFVDHFGEFIPLEEYHIRMSQIIGWKPTKSALVISPPDIGEEPD